MIFIFSLLSMFEILIFSNSFLEHYFLRTAAIATDCLATFLDQKICFFTLLKALLLSTTISCTRLIHSRYSVGYKKEDL